MLCIKLLLKTVLSLADLNENNLDTTKWEVQLDTVISPYCKVAIAAGFMIEVRYFSNFF